MAENHGIELAKARQFSIIHQYQSVRTSFDGRQACEECNGVHNRPFSFKASRSQNPCCGRVYDENVKEKAGQAGEVFASSICFSHLAVVVVAMKSTESTFLYQKKELPTTIQKKDDESTVLSCRFDGSSDAARTVAGQESSSQFRD